MTDKTDSKERDLMELVDAYAEARHIGGCHTYNAKAAEARNAVIASLAQSGFDAADMATAWSNGFRDGVASLAASAGGEPMFWVRLCSDGLYEGPIHNARIEKVRKLSGAWSPLYTHPSPPEGMVMVPLKFVQGFSRLAHNYSLRAVPPDYYQGTEGDAFSAAYRRCGQDLAELNAMLHTPPTSSADSSKEQP